MDNDELSLEVETAELPADELINGGASETISPDEQALDTGEIPSETLSEVPSLAAASAISDLSLEAQILQLSQQFQNSQAETAAAIASMQSQLTFLTAQVNPPPPMENPPENPLIPEPQKRSKNLLARLMF